MKVFLSHSSMNKTNVKAIVGYLPKQIKTWLDENNLIWGSKLDETFESVIKTEVDYVIVFLSGGRRDNEWVVKELNWALEHSKKTGRSFVLPVIMPGLKVDPYLEYPEIKNIKYITLDNYEETGFKSCAEKITTQLFALIINDLENMHKPKDENATKILVKANNYLDELCKLTYTIVFKHRINNPITVDELYEQLSEKRPGQFNREDFSEFLDSICSMLTGVYYDGFQLYLTEEHSQWKNNIEAENKTAIAYCASKYIRNGMTVFVDAGSTMSRLIDIVCKRLETHMLNAVNFIVVSTEHISKLADVCVQLGYDEYSSPIKIFVPSGQVRPNTKAIVGKNTCEQIATIVESLGGLDIAFVGVNGAMFDKGIYTHRNAEYETKLKAKELAKRVYFTFDDTKCGVELEGKMADFDEDIHIIINENKNNEELMSMYQKYPDKIELAKVVKK